jgi:hypothetical protein
MTKAIETGPPVNTQSVACPKCGRSNPGTAYFCTTCHQILIHRCPKCWHEQRAGAVCEKCGTCFALYWEQAFWPCAFRIVNQFLLLLLSSLFMSESTAPVEIIPRESIPALPRVSPLHSNNRTFPEPLLPTR